MKKSILVITLCCLLSSHPTKSLNSKEKKIKELEQQIEKLKKKNPNYENTSVAWSIRHLEVQIEKLQSSTSNTSSTPLSSFPKLPNKRNVYNIHKTPIGNVYKIKKGNYIQKYTSYFVAVVPL